VGPYVSVGKNSQVENAVVASTIIQENAKVKEANVKNSMIGNHAEVKGKAADLSLGDYNVLHI
jgi:glucose-1-phosphate thymidylyltransferase